jgi:hypothetical protein
MQHLATPPAMAGQATDLLEEMPAKRLASAVHPEFVREPQTAPIKESSVQDFGLLDQLHSLYAERERMEAAIGMSDADDVIRHVMHLRREQTAARSDLETSMDVLSTVMKRLEVRR